MRRYKKMESIYKKIFVTMPLVLKNDTARGRFIKYTSVGGITKSVFVDAFSEFLVPEVDSSDALVNKVDRAKLKRLEERKNEKTLSHFLYEKKMKSLRNVTKATRWQKKIVEIISDKVGVVFRKDGKSFVFSIDALGDLETIGSIVYNSSRFVTRLNSSYDGTYTYGADEFEIESGEIVSINGFGGSDSYTLSNNIGSTTYTTYVAGGDSIFGNGTTIYQDAELNTLYNLSTTLKYDVPSNNTNKKITFSNGVVQSSTDYTMEGETYYLSGSSGTSYTFYNETGEDVYDLSSAVYLYADSQGFSPVPATRTVFTVSPWKYLTIASGRIIDAGDINVAGGGGGGSDSYAFIQGRVNTTVYVSAGTALAAGVSVYTDAGLTTPLANGDYTNGGKTYQIKNGTILKVL